MMLYFHSNNKRIKAEVTSFEFMDCYLWVEQEDAMFNFNEVTYISTKPAPGLEYEDMSEVIRRHGCPVPY